MSENKQTERAVLGGGCFWCFEAVYQRLSGVIGVTSGYAGGEVADPTYEQVCGKQTGHAEVVAIEFDPQMISYAKLLDMFWRAHDPTTPDRQGNDIGPQYRSIILYDGPEQQKQAEESKKAAQADFAAPIVTEIVELEKFWPAEIEHHDYYNRNKFAPYCMMLIRPKLAKLDL